MSGNHVGSVWSVEAYLEHDAASNTRHEFLDGAIVAMAGGSRRHGTLILNLGAALHGQLRDSPCQPFTQDIRLANPESNSYFYPDLLVECPDGTSARARLVIEVLSPGTEAVDREFKRRAYRASISILDYLMVRQDRMFVEHDTRIDSAAAWEIRTYAEASDCIELASIGCSISLAEVYRRVEFGL